MIGRLCLYVDHGQTQHMANTNKYFDDKAILDLLKDKYQIDVSGAENLRVNVEYDAPVSNGSGMATVSVELSVWIKASEADAALRESMGSSSGS